MYCRSLCVSHITILIIIICFVWLFIVGIISYSAYTGGLAQAVDPVFRTRHVCSCARISEILYAINTNPEEAFSNLAVPRQSAKKDRRNDGFPRLKCRRTKPCSDVFFFFVFLFYNAYYNYAYFTCSNLTQVSESQKKLWNTQITYS